MAEAQSRAAEVTWASIISIMYLYWMPPGASLGRCSRCVPWGENPGEDPGHPEVTMSLG